MGRIEAPIDLIIQKKGFGIWPRDVIESDQHDPLVKTLNIEYRFEEYLFKNKLNGYVPLESQTDSPIGSFIKESKSLITSEHSSLTNFITLINIGQFEFLEGQIEESIKTLKSAEIEFDFNSDNYVQSLLYRRAFLLANAYHYLKDTKSEEQWLSNGVNSFNKIPTLSNIESIKWLRLIYDRLLIQLPTPTLSQLDKIFKYKNYIMSFVDYSIEKGIKYDSKELQAFVNNRVSQLLSATNFPKSDEANNYELEEFLSQVNDCKLIKPEITADLLEKGINRTYQSHILMRSLTKNFLLLGKSEESFHSFHVYMDYIERYYVQNNHSFNDILAILKTFDVVLGYKFLRGWTGEGISGEDYDRYVKILDKFEELLNAFYDDNELLKVDSEFDLLNGDLLNVNNDALKEFLSGIWYTLAVSNIRLHTCVHSLFPENQEKLTKSTTFFKNSIYNLPTERNVFQYVKYIASLRKIKEAYQILKNFLNNQTIKNLVYFQSWHLLALIVSIEENKDESYKIINFLVNEIQDVLETGSSLSLELKQTFIEIKITQLAIVESLFGIEQSLDSLPELFALFNQLFKDTISEPPTSEPTTNNLNRTSTLTKIKSIRSHKEIKTAPKPTTKQPPSIQNKLLQKIWLVSANIYFKANLLEDSEQAIAEAEKIYKPTCETHSTLGLITSVARPELALKEFEIALNIDRDYPLAIIGLSNLVLESTEIFISEKDSNAAIARVKILLELLTEKFNSSMISEVWFLLSKIYEKYGDKKRFRNSLWKSVELEETRPIRDFTNI